MIVSIDLDEALVLLKRRAKLLQDEAKKYIDDVKFVREQEYSIFVHENEYLDSYESLVEYAKDIRQYSFELQDLSEEILRAYKREVEESEKENVSE